jgi:hypothetical protein
MVLIASRKNADSCFDELSTNGKFAGLFNSPPFTLSSVEGSTKGFSADFYAE